jgi:hypothetical protein
MSISNGKKILIENGIFRIATNSAFSRNKVYRKVLSRADSIKFKDYLRKELSKSFEKICSKVEYSDSDHYALISRLSKKVTKRFSKCLNDRSFNIGTTQKMLNLYWKMKWVYYRNVPTPIHCPFDRIIINKLDKSVKHINWTEMTDISQYKALVKAAKDKCKNKYSLAKWELIEYNRLNRSSFVTI